MQKNVICQTSGKCCDNSLSNKMQISEIWNITRNSNCNLSHIKAKTNFWDTKDNPEFRKFKESVKCLATVGITT